MLTSLKMIKINNISIIYTNIKKKIINNSNNNNDNQNNNNNKMI